MTEEPNYVVESVPTQRAFDWTSLVPAASVPQVSVQEVISVDAGDDLSSPSSAPGSPKGPGLEDPGSPTSKSIHSVTSDASTINIDALTDLRYGEHMVFLVHGYAGSLQDLRLLRAHLQVACPNVHTRVSAANHERTGVDSIEAMGARLAEEVAETMEDLESGALVPRGAGGSPGRPRRRRRRRRRGSEPRRGYPSPRTPSAFSSSARR